uniref:Uncharacterized protein n=1 Tax=viral metagenome TaxID=1070528 RepID=A0A6H1ZPI8_9ZZZZ
MNDVWGKKVFWDEPTRVLYVKIPSPKEHGYPENTWIAIWGLAPELEVYSSTHMYEIPDRRIAIKLAELSGQKWFAEQYRTMKL